MFVRDDKLFIGTYVDDNLVIGEEDEILQFIKQVEKQGLKVTTESEVSDYLSCEVLLNQKKGKGWIEQPHILKKLEKTFGEKVKGMQVCGTAGTPRSGVFKKFGNSEAVSANEQKLY